MIATCSPIPIGFEIAILTAITWYVLKRKNTYQKLNLYRGKIKSTELVLFIFLYRYYRPIN